MADPIRLFVSRGERASEKAIDLLRNAGVKAEVIDTRQLSHGELMRDFATSNTPILTIPGLEDEVVIGLNRIASRVEDIRTKRR